ncbi:MAG: flagellar biosynthesis protein FlhA [Proteobacteria bacterium]|nr:flagellar biosynthesis protein FlhA [Pseudomonadota bacterium]MDA1356132.1 flagellar biosynthesis protein FlhA [Pseudomonadota bacterium]
MANLNGAPPDASAPGLALLESFKRGDVALALGVISILVILIMPMPSWLLDISLALSLAISALVLLTVLFIEKPLDLSAFPTILLIATMLRLALNLASTRLILTHGYEGPAAAGQVIQAFGGFVMGGSFVIGIIVFAILVIVNFIVITKGAGRIAEVSARFSLDAMPGKQMAIDADLSAGLIGEEEARQRRLDLEGESSFFGSMDGASKFVRGDAIAGLLITFINVIGGMIVGVSQNGMSFADAAQTFTMLTIGDGLVSQIPALIISTAAGLLVTKAGISGSADKLIFGQLSAYPRAIAMTAGLLVALALLPGIPMLPFLILAAVAGFIAWRAHGANHRRLAEAHNEGLENDQPEQPESLIGSALQIDALRLELGYGLLSLIDEQQGQRLTEQIKALRRQIANEMGFVMPSVRIQDNMQLGSNSYILRVKDIEAGHGELRPHMLLTMDPGGESISLPGEETQEPTFGMPAKWINHSEREEAMFRGYTVVDPATVITTHITETVKDNMAELLSYAETRKLLDDLEDDQRKLVDDLVPAQITGGAVQRILQNLLRERVSIRDLPTILEGIAEAVGHTQNVTYITEMVRARLARQICAANADGEGVLPLLTLSPDWEEAFAESLVGNGEDKQLSMAPSRLQEFIGLVRSSFERHAMLGELPVLLTSPAIRPYVRSIVERFRPATPVMSQNEIHPKIKLKTLGQV